MTELTEPTTFTPPRDWFALVNYEPRLLALAQLVNLSPPLDRPDGGKHAKSVRALASALVGNSRGDQALDNPRPGQPFNRPKSPPLSEAERYLRTPQAYSLAWYTLKSMLRQRGMNE